VRRADAADDVVRAYPAVAPRVRYDATASTDPDVAPTDVVAVVDYHDDYYDYGGTDHDDYHDVATDHDHRRRPSDDVDHGRRGG
jgi:hypothetical protein